MPPDPIDTAQLLRDLDRRLRAIESRLGIAPALPEHEPDAPAHTLAPLSISPEPDPAVADFKSPPAESTVLDCAAPATEPIPRPPPATAESIAQPAAASPRAAKPRIPTTAADVERMIGGRWFAAGGAVVVVIGVGLFLKLAYDRGWLNLIPPIGKCISGAAFGAALLIAGEFIRRRLGSLASAGVSAAGLGALFASVYAAFGVYGLIGPVAALGLLAGVCGLGFFIAAIGRSVSIAALSLVGAYVSPLVIGETPRAPLVLPIYLVSLLSLGLTLSAWRAVPFRILRGLVWWGTLLLGTYWVLTDGPAHPPAAVMFPALCWAAVHAELAVSARRPRQPPLAGIPPDLPWPFARFVATSLSTTAWSVALAVFITRHGMAIGDWIPPAVATGLTALLAAALAGRIRVLRDWPRNDRERLGAALAVQAGALLMSAVALGLSSWTETAAWLSLGLAGIASGRWIRSRGLDIYGLVALAVASGRLLIVDSPLMTPTTVLAEYAGLVFTRWTVLMAIGAAAWAAAAGLLRRAGPSSPVTIALTRMWARIPPALLIIALCHLNASLLTPGAEPHAVAAAWLALGILGLALGRILRWPAMGAYGLTVLALSTLRFLTEAPILGSEPGRLRIAAGVVISRWMFLMLSGAAAWGLALAIAPRKAGSSPASRALVASGPVISLALVSLSLVDPLADAAAVCMVWFVLGLIGLLLGPISRSLALSGFGLVMLAASSARLLFGSPLTGVPPAPLWTGMGLVVTRWTLFMLAGAAAWFIGAALAPGDRKPGDPTQITPTRAALAWVGLAMVLASLPDPRVQAGALSMAWLVVAVLAILAHIPLRRLALDSAGLLNLVLAAAAWAAEYPVGYMDSAAPPLAHPGLWTAAALAAAALGARALLDRVRPTHPAALGAIVPAAISIIFVSTSLEVARAGGLLASDPTVRRAALSIWWGLFAVALIAAGFARGRALPRHLGLALLACATAKALAHDLNYVTGLWRVASVVGLGLLMLGVAVGYARAAAHLRPREKSA